MVGSLAVFRSSVIYAVVFIGSGLCIALIVGLRVLVRQRMIRRFVRSVRMRFASAEARGALTMEERQVYRPHKSPRTSAIELQQVRTLLRDADKAWKQNHIDDVERILIQALTVHPLDQEASAQLARLYLTTGRESKAEAMYKELLQHYDDVSFHANLGLSYYKQAKYIDACFAYQEALNRDPKNPDRTAALGRACIAAGRFDEAAPLLQKASEYMNRDTNLLHMLADCYLQLNMREQAEETYRRINKLEPYNEDVKAKMKTIREEAAAHEAQQAVAA